MHHWLAEVHASVVQLLVGSARGGGGAAIIHTCKFQLRQLIARQGDLLDELAVRAEAVAFRHPGPDLRTHVDHVFAAFPA